MNKVFSMMLLFLVVGGCASGNKYNQPVYRGKSFVPQNLAATTSPGNYPAASVGTSGGVADIAIDEAKEFNISGNLKSTTGKLPRGYAGDNFNQIYERLAKAIPKKGEFEKESEYQERILSSEGRICVFKQVLDRSKKDSTFKYDPDAEMLVVMPHTSFLSLYQVKNSYVEFVISGSSANTGNRVAQNAFGARVVVKEYREAFCTIKAANTQRLLSATNPKGKDPNFNIKMTVPEAKRHKGNLDVLIIGVTLTGTSPTYTDSHYI